MARPGADYSLGLAFGRVVQAQPLIVLMQRSLPRQLHGDLAGLQHPGRHMKRA